MKFDPHYLKMVEQGVVMARTLQDFHLEGFPSDYCTRCGIDRPLKDKDLLS